MTTYLDRNSFIKICADLQTLGSPDHESLEFQQNTDGTVTPVTCKKTSEQWKSIFTEEESKHTHSLSDKLISFFKAIGKVDPALSNKTLRVLADRFGNKEIKKELTSLAEEFEKQELTITLHPNPTLSLLKKHLPNDCTLVCKDGKCIQAPWAILRQFEFFKKIDSNQWQRSDKVDLSEFPSLVIETFLHTLYHDLPSVSIERSLYDRLNEFVDFLGDRVPFESSEKEEKESKEESSQRPFVLLWEKSAEASLRALRQDKQSMDLKLNCSDGEVRAHSSLLGSIPKDTLKQLEKLPAQAVEHYLDLLYQTKKPEDLIKQPSSLIDFNNKPEKATLDQFLSQFDATPLLQAYAVGALLKNSTLTKQCTQALQQQLQGNPDAIGKALIFYFSKAKPIQQEQDLNFEYMLLHLLDNIDRRKMVSNEFVNRFLLESLGGTSDSFGRVTFNEDKDPSSYHFRAIYLQAAHSEKESTAEEAFKLYDKSSDLGYPPAWCQLGIYHENGHFVTKSRKLAVELYEMAAKEGFENAYLWLSKPRFDDGRQDLFVSRPQEATIAQQKENYTGALKQYLIAVLEKEGPLYTQEIEEIRAIDSQKLIQMSDKWREDAREVMYYLDLNKHLLSILQLEKKDSELEKKFVTLRNNKPLMLLLLSIYGQGNIQYCSKQLKEDKEVIIQSIKGGGPIPENMDTDPDIFIAIGQSGRLHQLQQHNFPDASRGYFVAMNSVRDFIGRGGLDAFWLTKYEKCIAKALETNRKIFYEYPPPFIPFVLTAFKQVVEKGVDKEIAEFLIYHPWLHPLAPERFLDNAELFIKSLSLHKEMKTGQRFDRYGQSFNWKSIPKKLWENETFAWKALEVTLDAIPHISSDFLRKEKFRQILLQHNPETIKKYLREKPSLLAMLPQDNYDFIAAAMNLRDDERDTDYASENTLLALSKEAKNVLISELIKRKYWDSLAYIVARMPESLTGLLADHKELKDNWTFIQSVLEKRPQVLEYLPSQQQEKLFKHICGDRFPSRLSSEEFSIRPDLIARMPKSFHCNEEFMLYAIEKYPVTYRFVDPSLRKKIQFAAKAVKRNGLVLALMEREYQEDPWIVKLATEQNPKAKEFSLVKEK